MWGNRGKEGLVGLWYRHVGRWLGQSGRVVGQFLQHRGNLRPSTLRAGCSHRGQSQVLVFRFIRVRERDEMEILGLSGDVVLTILLLVGWVVLMRFVLPRLGIST
jgi:hypothetical protein